MICLSAKLALYKTISNKYDSNSSNAPILNILNSFFCYGSVSIIEHPFENVFIRISNRKIGNKLIAGLYKGYSVTLCRQLTCSILLPISDMYKKYINNIVIASALASITTTLVTHPIDNIRIQKISTNKINWSIVYRGISLSLIRNVGHFSLLSYIYQKINNI